MQGQILGAQGRPFGTGTVALNGGMLQMRTNAGTFNGGSGPGGINGTILVGNNVTIAAGQPGGAIDLASAGATGNTFLMFCRASPPGSNGPNAVPRNAGPSP